MRGDKLKGTLLYYLFKSMGELGLDMNLLFRRLSVIASKDIDYISKEFFNGKINSENFEQTVSDLVQILKNEGLVEEVAITSDDGVITLEVKGCTYLAMAEKAIQHGEKTCPLCLISLAVSLPAMLANGEGFNLAERETDPSNKRCILKISHKV